MLIVMDRAATPDQIEAVAAKIKALGMPGVREAISVTKPYKLVSRQTHPRDTVIEVRGITVGVGVQGLIIEVHADPHSALSDGAQSLWPDQFGGIM
ncbi:MAG: hypothetical protein M1457_10495 [bacterium]|nr:hypothetical protein [bacterium]